MNEEQPTVAAEAAEQEFARFVEAMDLDIDPEGMDDEDRRSFEREKRIFLREVGRGRLVVDEAGQPVFTPSEGEPITFHEPDGAALMEMDKVKAGKTVKQGNLVLAAITKKPAARFARMKMRDLKVCQAIMNFLIGG